MLNTETNPEKGRKLMRRGTTNVVQWYCAGCAWSEVIVLGRPGEMSGEEAQSAFEKHMCGEKSPKRRKMAPRGMPMAKAAAKK
jgi:hypothetical protein